ncbi:hypothetical protein [Hydrogenobaculum phage 1]|uniref:hypothetical protein n=1 Tax=Hydrogenobaculum phage 1 TaxID=1732176 RepID=UPI000705E8B8|nr:hypothetical protein AUR69_gp04 [Hydrogenobaculum phage 1]ALG96915.1 hypothetical protein [Hydrogenobaculum phage 1]
MPKTWKELAEELKSLAEVLLEQAKQAFREGDIERGLMLTKEFRSAIKTAGDLNMIAQGAGELEEDFEEEDIEKALGLEDEEDLEEEEEEDEIEEYEESEEDYDEYTDDDEELEEEADNDENELETDYDFAEEERKKIKTQVGDSIISLEQILRGIARKKT